MKKSIIHLLMCFLVVGGYAQEKSKLTSTNKHATILQLHAGTNGLGIDLKQQLSKRFFLRGGFNSLSFNVALNLKSLGAPSDFKADFNGKANLSNCHLFTEFAPFNKNAFRLVGGVGYFSQANIQVSIQPTDSYKYQTNNTTQSLSTSQIGNYLLNIDWKGLSPYLGMSFFKAVPKRKLNFGLDVGVYHMNQPKVAITANGALKPNEASAMIIQNNMSDYTWLPNFQLTINYKIK